MSARTLQLTEPVRDYLLSVGIDETPELAALREETATTVEQAGMQISPEQGAFMAWLVRLVGARRVVEVGTFTGYSALAMAQALPEDGRIVCCDVSEEWTSIGVRHWRAAGVHDRIDLRLAPALDTLDGLLNDGEAGTFDLAFVDADKTNYLGYHARCVELLRPGGVAMYDNVLWGGSVANPEDTRESTVALRELSRVVAEDARVERVMLPIGDGLLLARKR